MICFQKPFLHHLKLSLSPTSAEFLLQVLITFFSMPCSHDQTLTFRMNLCDESSMPKKSSKPPPVPLHTPAPLQDKLDKGDEAPLVPPKPLQHKFDDTCTLQYKSLVFESCGFHLSFTRSVFGLPLKLKQFIINDLHFMDSSVFSQLAQLPNFDMHSLKISSMGMSDITFSDYNALLQKKSLNNASFIHCSSIDAPALHRAARMRGFHLEEK